MKILIAYDGSETKALTTLGAAGLPMEADALVYRSQSVESWRYARITKGGIMPELMDNRSHLHCSRCDSENRHLIKFKSADNQPSYLCSRCVEQEDKREMKFSNSWRRSRRSASKIAVAAS